MTSFRLSRREEPRNRGHQRAGENLCGNETCTRASQNANLIITIESGVELRVDGKHGNFGNDIKCNFSSVEIIQTTSYSRAYVKRSEVCASKARAVLPVRQLEERCKDRIRVPISTECSCRRARLGQTSEVLSIHKQLNLPRHNEQAKAKRQGTAWFPS